MIFSDNCPDGSYRLNLAVCEPCSEGRCGEFETYLYSKNSVYPAFQEKAELHGVDITGIQ